MNRIQENSFLLCIGAEDVFEPAVLGTAKVNRRGILLFETFANPSHFKLVDDGWDVIAYFGAELHRNPRYADDFLTREWDHAEDCGALVHLRGRDRSVSIHSDFLGTEIIYYAQEGRTLVISNRIENINAVKPSAPDYAGVFQFLAGAFTVGTRTTLEGIKQSRPSSTVVLDFETGGARESFHKSWRKDSLGNAEAHRNYVRNRWKSLLAGLPGYVVMLSAGWDSRLLLTGANISSTYTHGDLKSREVSLAFRLASEKSLSMVFNPLEAADYSVERLMDMNRRLGHAFFPHWYYAAEYCARRDAYPITAGLCVEHVSGHYGINSLGSGVTKLKSVAASMIAPRRIDALEDAEAIELLIPLLSYQAKSRPWYMGDDWQDYFADAGGAFTRDVRMVLDDYVSQGTTGAQELCERFRLEHSGRQYFANQTKCALPFNGYYHPYADSRLSQAVVRIPYRERVNYKLSRSILQHTDPTLLEFPMAATLVKARRPILTQEGSRLARIALQRLHVMSVVRHGSRLGWNNFEFLLNRGVMHDYVESLRGGMWNRENMHRFVRAYDDSGGNAYSLLDMFSKIVTIDHRIYAE